MYEAFYGLREKPFTLLPDPSFLYLSKRHVMALTMLEYGLQNQAGIIVITGEIGSGKTTLVRHVLNQLGDDTVVGLISNTHAAFGELLEWVLLAFGLEFKGRSKAEMYQSFVEFMVEQYAHGRRTVLIVDEAQNMDARTLEELRVISNVNADKDQVIQLLLVGQPELRGTLRRPDLEQFAQRVSVDYHLAPFVPEETEAYISHRLQVAGGDPELFERLAKRFIHFQCRGTPRLINSLCDLSLVYGFAAQARSITVELVHEVVQDKNRSDAIGLRRRGPGRRPAVSPRSPWYEDLAPEMRRSSDEALASAVRSAQAQAAAADDLPAQDETDADNPLDSTHGAAGAREQ